MSLSNVEKKIQKSNSYCRPGGCGGKGQVMISTNEDLASATRVNSGAIVVRFLK
jgi:hypothetical protein